MDEARKQGAPVDWVRTLDPVVTSPSVIAVSANAPHPKEARLLADFVLSDEGQQLIAKQGLVPARATGPSALRLYYVRPELAREMDAREREFNDIFLKVR